MADVVQENMAKAQTKQKQWYDKGARLPEFEKGDLVLVLLPTTSSKLLAQWQGPYQVVERTGKVTYKIDMHDKRKRYRVFHVNTLKAFEVRLNEPLSAMMEEVTEETDGDEVLLWNDNQQGTPSTGEELTDAQRSQLHQVLSAYKDVLQPKQGRTNLAEHQITTDGSKPVRLPPYRLPHAYRDIVHKELQEMLDTGIIEKSTSDWAAPIVLVKTKDGSLRMCVDYRQLNSVSQVDAYPMPRIDDLIDRLGQAKFISTLDLTKGYLADACGGGRSTQDCIRDADGTLSIPSYAVWFECCPSFFPTND